MAKLFEVVDGKVIVTTSTGWRVECLPYGADLARAGTALVFPKTPIPPTYVIGKAEDDLEPVRVPYTAESIDDEKTPAEDTEAWGVYMLALQAYNRESAILTAQVSLMRARVIANRAIIIYDLPDLAIWAKKQVEYYGLPLSGDSDDLLLDFFSAEVSKTEADVLNIMAGVMRASGANEEALDQFEVNFRAAVGRTEGEDDNPDSETVAATTEDAEKGLVDGTAVESA